MINTAALASLRRQVREHAKAQTSNARLAAITGVVPGAWEVLRFGRQASIYVARENGEHYEVMLTSNGRRRTFRTEEAARAAIAQVAA